MQPSSMQSWVMAIRPRTLPAAIGPLLVGNMLAIGLSQFSFLIAFTSMLCAILLQISVNLANDYFDFKNGIDTEERIGPVRVTQSGIIEPHHVKNAMIGCLLTALAVGSVLIFHGGWPIAILAIASILGALCYSGGPYPLASHGLGEIAAFVFFGLVIIMSTFEEVTFFSETDVNIYFPILLVFLNSFSILFQLFPFIFFLKEFHFFFHKRNMLF